MTITAVSFVVPDEAQRKYDSPNPGKLIFLFRIWQRKLLHKCFNITSQTQFCKIMKETSVSPDECARGGARI
jgi:hypothetical protein